MVVLAVAHDQRAGYPSASSAPQTLNQPILPGWLPGNTVNVTEENSSSPETEQKIVESHSYGQQLGRVLDVVKEPIAGHRDRYLAAAGAVGDDPADDRGDHHAAGVDQDQDEPV